jgi:hypothetical protein
MRAFIVILMLPGGRFHPCFYFEDPLPGGGPPELWRFRSGGHHTSGFGTFAEAATSARELGSALDANTPYECPPSHVIDQCAYDSDGPANVVITRPFGDDYALKPVTAIGQAIGMPPQGTAADGPD